MVTAVSNASNASFTFSCNSTKIKDVLIHVWQIQISGFVFICSSIQYLKHHQKQDFSVKWFPKITFLLHIQHNTKAWLLLFKTLQLNNKSSWKKNKLWQKGLEHVVKYGFKSAISFKIYILLWIFVIMTKIEMSKI